MSTDLSRGKPRLHLILAAGAVMVLAAAAALASGCHKGDKIAPDGAIINLAANPATIIKVSGTGSAEIVATVSSAVGVPLEDQDVRFSSTAGQLATPPPENEPAANVPIRTDSLGNAHVILTSDRNTTVTARSGTASGTLTLDAVDGDLDRILLNPDTTSTGCLVDQTFQSCSDDRICLVAQAQDTDGVGLPGVTLVFRVENAFSNGDPFTFSFTVVQGTTDANGEVRTVFRLGKNCPTACADFCSGDLVASTQGGAFVSTPVSFDTNIQ